MRTTTTLLALAALGATAFGQTAGDLPALTEEQAMGMGLFIDDEAWMDDMDCLQLTRPGAASLNGVTDDGRRVDLHVRLVLDVADGRALDATPDDPDTPQDERQAAIDAYGQEVVDEHLAAGLQSYDEIDVDLNYASFDLLEIDDLRDGDRAPRLEGSRAIQLAKDQYGGERPAGTDIVYVLSDRDLTNGGSSALAGLADCIGGVASPKHAFATGELDPNAEFGLGPARFYVDYTAKVAAHEVGHLMGAHHHYQACGPYAAESVSSGVGACTLMTNFVDLVTFPLSPTNQVVVRGHAVDFADEDAAGADEHDHDH